MRSWIQRILYALVRPCRLVSIRSEPGSICPRFQTGMHERDKMRMILSCVANDVISGNDLQAP
jgi:hypothetical protein